MTVVRGGTFVGDRKPHMLFRNGYWRMYSLLWDSERRHTVGLRLGLGFDIDGAYNRWLDDDMFDSGATLYTRRL